MEDDQKFLTYCRMTCPKGSEEGTCPCYSPKVCEMRTHPRYAHYRERLAGQMFQHIKNAIQKPEETP